MRSYFEVFPENKKRKYFSCGGYEDITREIGTSDYQGDTRVLFERQGEFGYLQFGWGSCSGCDALEACDSPAEWESLANQMEAETKWMPKAEMLAWFKTHDWKGDYSWHDDEQKRFISQAIAYMEKDLGVTP